MVSTAGKHGVDTSKLSEKEREIYESFGGDYGTRREKIPQKDEKGEILWDEKKDEPLWETEKLTQHEALQRAGGPGRTTKQTNTFIMYTKGQIADLRSMIPNA